MLCAEPRNTVKAVVRTRPGSRLARASSSEAQSERALGLMGASSGLPLTALTGRSAVVHPFFFAGLGFAFNIASRCVCAERMMRAGRRASSHLIWGDLLQGSEIMI